MFRLIWIPTHDGSESLGDRLERFFGVATGLAKMKATKAENRRSTHMIQAYRFRFPWPSVDTGCRGFANSSLETWADSAFLARLGRGKTR